MIYEAYTDKEITGCLILRQPVYVRSCSAAFEAKYL